MIRKLSLGLAALALCVGSAMPALAQDVIAAYFDNAGELERFGTVPGGAPFDLVVQTETDSPSSASEFIITELLVEFPGILKTGTSKINGTNLDLGNNDVGEYLLAYQICSPAGTAEVVRISYFDISGLVPANYFIKLRGYGPGDTQPSSFNGSTGYVDCQSVKIPLNLKPYPIASADVPIDPTKVGETGDGATVLNPEPPIPAEVSSMGELKARF